MKEEEIVHLERDMISSISLKDLADRLIDASEILLDSGIPNGLIKEIPIISTIYSFGRVGIAIRDRIFIKKLLRFLIEISKVSEKEREEFGQKMEADKEFSHKVGETLIITLDRLDNINKSEYLAKLFNSVIKKRITYDTFLGLSYALDKAIISDISLMVDYYKRGKVLIGDNSIWQRLFSTGLTNFDVGVSQAILITESGSSSSFAPSFYPNKDAELFALLILE